MFKNKQKKTDGRKFRMALVCLMILVIGFSVSGLNPAVAALYPELITGILGVLFVYSGGNVANKWAIGKPGSIQMSYGNQNRREVLDGSDQSTINR